MQRRLASASQLDIDRGQQLGAEQCAMFAAVGAINVIAPAQVVERVMVAGVLARTTRSGTIATRVRSTLTKAMQSRRCAPPARAENSKWTRSTNGTTPEGTLLSFAVIVAATFHTIVY
jgi:hypothetical protein